MFYLIKCCNLRNKKRPEMKIGTWFRSLSCDSAAGVPGSPVGEGSESDRALTGRGLRFPVASQKLCLSQPHPTERILVPSSVTLHWCIPPLLWGDVPPCGFWTPGKRQIQKQLAPLPGK